MTKFVLGQTVRTYNGQGIVVKIEPGRNEYSTTYFVEVNGDCGRHGEKHLRGLDENKPWEVASVRLIMGQPNGYGMIDSFDDPEDAEATLMRWAENKDYWGGVVYIESRLHIGIWREGKGPIVCEVAHPPFAITKNPCLVADSTWINTHIPLGHVAPLSDLR